MENFSFATVLPKDSVTLSNVKQYPNVDWLLETLILYSAII